VPGRVGVDFATNDELRTALAATPATPEQVDEAVAISEDARLRALRASFLIVGDLVVVDLPRVDTAEGSAAKPGSRASGGRSAARELSTLSTS
jgi:hypothetical protein